MSTVGGVTLTEFLLARIEEDEAAARAPSPSGRRLSWRLDLMVNDDEEAVGFCVVSSDNMAGVADALGLERGTGEAVAVHIARHDPARVLAECEAKRRILAEHSFHVDPTDGPSCNCCATGDDNGPPWPCDTVRALASVYADHPDYREEWNL